MIQHCQEDHADFLQITSVFKYINHKSYSLHGTLQWSGANVELTVSNVQPNQINQDKLQTKAMCEMWVVIFAGQEQSSPVWSTSDLYN